MNVSCQHRQCHIDIQAMHLQAIDDRLHRRVSPAGFDEFWRLLFFFGHLAEFALSGQHHQVELPLQSDLVVLGMKAFVKAAQVEFRETLFGLGEADLVVGTVLDGRVCLAAASRGAANVVLGRQTARPSSSAKFVTC